MTVPTKRETLKIVTRSILLGWTEPFLWGKLIDDLCEVLCSMWYVLFHLLVLVLFPIVLPVAFFSALHLQKGVAKREAEAKLKAKDWRKRLHKVTISKEF